MVAATKFVQLNDECVFFAPHTSNSVWSASGSVLVGGVCIVIRALGRGEERVQRLQPECLRFKHTAKVAGHLLRKIFQSEEVCDLG